MKKQSVLEDILNVENAVNEVDMLVHRGVKALEDFLQLDQEKINYIVAKKHNVVYLKIKLLKIYLRVNMS